MIACYQCRHNFNSRFRPGRWCALATVPDARGVDRPRCKPCADARGTPACVPSPNLITRLKGVFV